MKTTKLIDVTLRDGGYKTNFHFQAHVIENILTCLDNSGIDYIEIGYRNGSFKPIQNMGPAGYCKNDYIKFCARFVHRAKLTVMFHPHQVTAHDFDDMHRAGVKAVRLCFSPQHMDAARESLAALKNYPFDVFVNLTRVSQYNPQQLLRWMIELAEYPIKAFYLADSNGNLNPPQVEALCYSLGNNLDIPLGFHAHDNLYLAQANAIAALGTGVRYLDGSLHGLGKGGGNLRTEIIATLLNEESGSHYDVCRLLNMAQSISAMIGIPVGDISAKEIIHGLFNLSQDEIPSLGDFTNTHAYYDTAKKFRELNVGVHRVA